MAPLLPLQHIPEGPRNEGEFGYDSVFDAVVVVTGLGYVHTVNKGTKKEKKAIFFSFKGVDPGEKAVANSQFPDGFGMGKLWRNAACVCEPILKKALEDGKPVKLKNFVRRRWNPCNTLENNHKSDDIECGDRIIASTGQDRPELTFFANVRKQSGMRQATWMKAGIAKAFSNAPAAKRLKPTVGV